uniref:AlNc14C116G6537 protein n=1 Tax=Albugo laibachii Nc14 TaxID=890382 RepID=F0WJ01_9STRA|nr:AlNc14C116G6537 [Albugo laibachii Nc14]|eukprot:CCA21247.1 AlNc14C116G6537 [Albugo laibachii Nc14]
MYFTGFKRLSAKRPMLSARGKKLKVVVGRSFSRLHRNYDIEFELGNEVTKFPSKLFDQVPRIASKRGIKLELKDGRYHGECGEIKGVLGAEDGLDLNIIGDGRRILRLTINDFAVANVANVKDCILFLERSKVPKIDGIVRLGSRLL